VALPPEIGWREMCPQRFVPSYYDSEKLRVLQQAFDDAWEVIPTPLHTDELRDELAKAIVTYASNGVSDLDQLRDLAFKALRDRGRLV
jgi:hypothetical protein